MLPDQGVLILRLAVGLLFIAHGTGKLFGGFGGEGLAATTRQFRALGLRPPREWAIMAGIVEAVGGVLLVEGFLSPLGSVAIIASMLVAILMVHWPKLRAAEGGFEYPLVIIAAVTTVAFTGPGLYSTDASLGTALPMPAAFLGGLSLVLLGVGVALVTAVPRTRPDVAPEPIEDMDFDEYPEEERAA